jgi:hypothetical protein
LDPAPAESMTQCEAISVLSTASARTVAAGLSAIGVALEIART